MNAVEILSQGTMKAAVLHLTTGTSLKDIDAGKLAECLRETIKSELDTVMSEWREATEANMSEAWLRELMNAQCNELALKALKAGQFI